MLGTAVSARLVPRDDTPVDVAAAFASLVAWQESSQVAVWDGLGVQGPPDMAPEALVEVAEYAAQVQAKFSLARDALTLYFREDPDTLGVVCGVV